MSNRDASRITDANEITRTDTTKDKVFKVTGIVTTDAGIAHAMAGTLFFTHSSCCASKNTNATVTGTN
jgi:hypothetical protein